MSLSPEDIQTAADLLDRAERTHTQIPLLSGSFAGMDMDDAYAIQSAWVARKCSRGDRIAGWKIGLTSKAMQAALSIDIPDSGVLLDSMLFKSGVTIAKNRFIQPRIEAEIAFVLKAPLSGAKPSFDEIFAATDYIVPALEILDTRIMRKDPASGRARNVFDTISDNAANAGVVTGTPIRDFPHHDMRWIGAIVSRNGSVEETGLGAGVLNNPLLAIAWLAERLGRYGGSLDAGQLILSGSFIRPIEAPPGSFISADFGPFGRVECHFN
jgi:2-oxo-hept-3-ene-1,7-dioate hydratase